MVRKSGDSIDLGTGWRRFEKGDHVYADGATITRSSKATNTHHGRFE
jgi:hypothetical protein